MVLSYIISAHLASLTNVYAVRFYGMKENAREVEMDMREMVDRVKKGEPIYGVSSLSPYMQGVAARNSRYTGIWTYVIPWFNFVNHPQVRVTASSMIRNAREADEIALIQHGVDTSKYYQQAEREIEAERLAREGTATASGTPDDS